MLTFHLICVICRIPMTHREMLEFYRLQAESEVFKLKCHLHLKSKMSYRKFPVNFTKSAHQVENRLTN